MSVAVRIASEFDQDVMLQILWYLRHADVQVAGDCAGAVDATLEFLGRFPEAGPLCRFQPLLDDEWRMGDGFLTDHGWVPRRLRRNG